MHALWSEEAEREGTSRVTWEIEPVGDSCRLTVIHDQLSETAPEEIYGGWPMILSGLKTWLETGETLTTPGSLMYSGQLTRPERRDRHARRPSPASAPIGVKVSDQDAATEFYVGALGFEKRLDAPISPTMRWIEVAPPGATTSIGLN